MEKTVKAFAKNRFQEVRVGISEFRGNNLINIRVWTKLRDSDEVVPTSKGISINVKLYPELKEAILALGKELEENNLI
jgi:hypothetical protein